MVNSFLTIGEYCGSNAGMSGDSLVNMIFVVKVNSTFTKLSASHWSGIKFFVFSWLCVNENKQKLISFKQETLCIQ